MHYFDEEEVNSLGADVHHVDIELSPYMVRNNRKVFLQLVQIVREYIISIIQCYAPVGGVLGRLLGKYFKEDRVKVIYTAYGFHFYRGAPWINNSVYYWVERMLAHYTDILVVINSEDYENAGKFRMRTGGGIIK